MNRPLHLLIVLSSLLLAACSSAQLVYRNADFVLGGYAEDLLDLDDAQVEVWEPQLDAVLARHREVELPAVVALLGGFERGAREGFSEAGLGCLRDRAWTRWRGTLKLLAEATAPLLVDLRPAQVAHLRERLLERDEEYREEHLDAEPAQRREARVERMIKRISRWTGRLDGSQRALVTRHMAGWPALAQGWYDYRTAQQRQLLTMIEAGASRDRLEGFLLGWWVRQADMPAALRAERRVVESGMLRLFVDLQQTLGDEQHQQLVDAFGDLRRSLAALLPADTVAAAIAGMDCDPRAGVPAAS